MLYSSFKSKVVHIVDPSPSLPKHWLLKALLVSCLQATLATIAFEVLEFLKLEENDNQSKVSRYYLNDIIEILFSVKILSYKYDAEFQTVPSCLLQVAI